MNEYFDRDFFKFLLGFTAIVSISLAVILVTQDYQNSKNSIEVIRDCESSSC